jgi:hypothetical protein
LEEQLLVFGTVVSQSLSSRCWGQRSGGCQLAERSKCCRRNAEVLASTMKRDSADVARCFTRCNIEGGWVDED